MNKQQQLALEDATQALCYLEVARRALIPETWAGAEVDDLTLHRPVAFLIGHAVELGLNAWLRIEGERGGQSNHDLLDRLEHALKAGLTVSNDFERYVRAMSPSHASSQFRYARSQPLAFVTPRRAIPIVAPEIARINQHVLDRCVAAA